MVMAEEEKKQEEQIKMPEKPEKKAEKKVEKAPVPAPVAKKDEKKKDDKKEENPVVPKKDRPRKSVAKFENARISLKHSKILLNKIRGRHIKKAKGQLEGLLTREKNIEGKYYSKASKKILEVLINAESNAKSMGMDDERLVVDIAKAAKGRTFTRPRTRGGRSGEKAKMTNLEIVLRER
jgi:ribosomal protein L22